MQECIRQWTQSYSDLLSGFGNSQLCLPTAVNPKFSSEAPSSLKRCYICEQFDAVGASVLIFEIIAGANTNMLCMCAIPCVIAIFVYALWNGFKTMVQELQECILLWKSNSMLLWLKAGRLAYLNLLHFNQVFSSWQFTLINSENAWYTSAHCFYKLYSFWHYSYCSNILKTCFRGLFYL